MTDFLNSVLDFKHSVFISSSSCLSSTISPAKWGRFFHTIPHDLQETPDSLSMLSIPWCTLHLHLSSFLRFYLDCAWLFMWHEDLSYLKLGYKFLEDKNVRLSPLSYASPCLLLMTMYPHMWKIRFNFFWTAPHSMWEASHPALEVWSSNHWVTREVPTFLFKLEITPNKKAIKTRECWWSLSVCTSFQGNWFKATLLFFFCWSSI